MFNPYLSEASSSLSDFQKRDDLVKRYSWAIPNEGALSAIIAAAPNGVVEVGAGSGYWARCLAERGADVLAFDREPWHRLWHPVSQGDTSVLTSHSERALMLCWPPYDDSMAADALRAFSGSTLIYIGESWGGCTGDDAFHELLRSSWDTQQVVDIPQWFGIHDYLSIHRRH